MAVEFPYGCQLSLDKSIQFTGNRKMVHKAYMESGNVRPNADWTRDLENQV